jgi:lysophospholipase L1-like esterase
MIGRVGVALSALVFVLVLGAQASASAPPTNYAFGDSVAAGYGLPPLSNPSAEDTSCGRSSQSYSALATAAVGAINTNFACGGYTTSGVMNEIKEAQAKPKPNYVTLTIGANDTGWTQWISDCENYTDCGGPTKTAAFNSALATYKTNLKQVISTMVTTLQPKQILVTGYYAFFGNDSSCGAGYGVTAAEAATIDSRLAAVSSIAASVAAGFPTATYVPISFNGQGICSASSVIFPAGVAAFGHPTLAGQQMIANEVLAKVK